MPELRPSQRPFADIVIRYEHLDVPRIKIDKDGTCVHFTPAEAYFYWQPVGTFLIRNGNEIVVDPLPGVEERIVRLPLLGTVLAVLLHQRGHLVLHASAVAVGGNVAIFVGEKAQGKSTLAATLYARGHMLMTDDLVALDVEDVPRSMVRPGFPQFKLWPDAAASSLGDDPAQLPLLMANYEKRARRVTQQFSQESLPLGAIFVLGVGSTTQIQRLQPQQAMFQLIAHTYLARFGNQVLQGAAAATHLRQCADLVGSIPIYLLQRPRNLELLPDIALLIEEQMWVRG